MAKRLVILVSVVLLAAGCAGAGGNAGSSTGDSDVTAGTTGPTGNDVTTGETSAPPETTEDTAGSTAGSSQTGGVQLEQLSSGAMGPERRQILIASSARDLAAATGLEIPDSGEGTYVAVSWGEKPTGGYTVDFGSAKEEGARVTVNVALKPPPEDAMVSQALTYPYAVAVLPGVDTGEKEFVFVTQNGREIGWPVRSV